MPRTRKPASAPQDPITSSVDALRRALGESEEDWEEELRDLTPSGAPPNKGAGAHRSADDEGD